VTGQSAGNGSSDDYLTIGYDASTGAALWTERYNGQGNNVDQANCVVTSPDGSTLFVTGFSKGSGGRYDYATIAYDEATGSVLWTERYNGPANRDDYAWTDTVSPDGSTVYVTGYGYWTLGTSDYATIAYDSSLGTAVWINSYDGPANGNDYGYSVTVAPDGSTVYVTGESDGIGTSADYATVAYAA
jgi:PQQ-like domain